MKEENNEIGSSKKNLPDRKSGCKLLKIGIFRKLKESVIP
ncbi:hypothetical protein D932_00717 [Enterococcus casseliflavus 14-MB-W-14]|nr:hypothetical protein D932_00717 [Enterococcus casseliflavus 14-MB-W-14]